MRAVVIEEYGDPEVLQIAERPQPVCGPSQVRVRVGGAAVNPTDAKVRAGLLTDWVPATFPWVLGWDLAGTVDAVGEQTSGWHIGDHVVALWDQHDVPVGSYAEMVVLDQALLAPAPRSLSLHESATLPLAGVTAAQALQQLSLGSDALLLVTGGSGLVGRTAIRLAVHAGVRVVATARSQDGVRAALAAGAERVLSPEEWGSAHVDGVLHTAGPVAVVEALKDEGSWVSVVPGGTPPPERGIRATVHYVVPDGALLAEISLLADEGVLVHSLSEVVPLEGAAQAHRRLASGGGSRVVLAP